MAVIVANEGEKRSKEQKVLQILGIVKTELGEGKQRKFLPNPYSETTLNPSVFSGGCKGLPHFDIENLVPQNVSKGFSSRDIS